MNRFTVASIAGLGAALAILVLCVLSNLQSTLDHCSFRSNGRACFWYT